MTGPWMRRATVVVVLGALAIAGMALRQGDGPNAVATDASADARRSGPARQELIRRYSETGAMRRSVSEVLVKRTTWGEYAAAADLKSDFTVPEAEAPPAALEVYVVLIRGDIDPAPGYPEAPGRPAYQYQVIVLDAALDKPLFEEAKPGVERPAYFARLSDRPDPT